ncbi:MAG: hypothetical protein HYX34_13820 [Actinobacteria bacterium]|nr:hypothetical protein [Actinomycetota bacterium]
MAASRPAADQQPHDKSTGDTISELWDLLRSYAKQETIDPLKQLKGFVTFGLAGAALLGIGVSVLAVAVLRVLQTELRVGTRGSLSWTPYVVALALTGAGTLLSLKAIRKQGRPG